MSEEEPKTKIPLWARIISWIFGGIITIIALSVFVVGSWSLGVSMLMEMKEFGLFISLITLGVGSLLFLLSTFMFVLLTAIIKRVTKWKWLQIPME